MAESENLAAAARGLPVVNRRRFRSWTEADAPSLVAAWTDTAVTRWNPAPADSTLATAVAWIAGTTAQTTSSLSVDLVLVDERDVVVGELGLQIDRHRRIAELGFWVAAAARRTGVGGDMLGLVPHVLGLVDVDHAFALVAPENEPALGLIGSVEWSEVETTGERRGFVVSAAS